MATDQTDATNRRRSARVLRGGVSVATLAAFVVLVLGKRTALTRSLGRIGHPQWSWIALGVLLEASSMATFAMMQRRLLRVGGRRVGTGPMMVTTLSANALSVSVPVAGPELGAAFTFRRFKEQEAVELMDVVRGQLTAPSRSPSTAESTSGLVERPTV